MFRRAAVCSVVCVLVSLNAQAREAPLIARETFLSPPTRGAAKLSLDGRRVGWLQRGERGVSQLWVRSVGGTDDVLVAQSDASRTVRSWAFTTDSTSVLIEFEQGTETHVFVSELTGGPSPLKDVTPWPKVTATLLAQNPRGGDVVLVLANKRDRKVPDVWRLNLRTQNVELEAQNPGDAVSFHVDSAFSVRGMVATLRDGSTELRVRDTAKAPWRALITASLDENVSWLDFTDDGRSVTVSTSINADTARVVEKSLKTGSERLLVVNEKSDVLDTFTHPVKRGVRAVAFDVNGRKNWVATDYNVKADFDALTNVLQGDFSVINADAADQRWLVYESRDVGPGRYWLYERRAKKAELLFSARPELDAVTLAAQSAVSIPSRDGLALPGYLTRSALSGPGPLVLLVHSGPWARDTWGDNLTAQWLANRGYSVLQVNFRGSTGYGKRFLNAGNREWGYSMQNDLLDAVAWAVSTQVADPSRIAVMGSSYGGYATLAALAFAPETFACGAEYAGPANLFSLLATSLTSRSLLARRIGNPDDPGDRERLTKASPLLAVDRIKGPLLVGQGGANARPNPAETGQISASLSKRGITVVSVAYADEGSTLSRLENQLDFAARAEGLFASCLKGRAEPLPREGRIAGSTAQLQVSGAASGAAAAPGR